MVVVQKVIIEAPLPFPGEEEELEEVVEEEDIDEEVDFDNPSFKETRFGLITQRFGLRSVIHFWLVSPLAFACCIASVIAVHPKWWFLRLR